VLAILADAAHADGIVWWSQELLAEYANCSVREVRRATDELERLVDVESRLAQRGRSRIKVYRLLPGRFGELDVDYERLPFRIDEPFSHPDKLSGRRAALAANPHHDWRVAEPKSSPGQIVRSSELLHPDISSDSPGHLVRDDRTSRPPAGSGLVLHARGNGVEALSEAPMEATDSSSEEDSSVPAAAGEGDDPTEQLRWALTAELGCTPKTRSEHGHWSKAIAELVEAEATAEQVRDRCALYRRRWPTAALTPIALVRHWGFLGSAESGVAEAKEEWVEKTSWQLDREDAHWIVDEWDDVDDEQRQRFHELVELAAAAHAKAVA
jgi:hypothetical protein